MQHKYHQQKKGGLKLADLVSSLMLQLLLDYVEPQKEFGIVICDNYWLKLINARFSDNDTERRNNDYVVIFKFAK